MRKAIVVVLALTVVAAATAATLVYKQTQQPYRGYTGVELFVEIPAGASTRSIGDRLVSAGVIRDSLIYRLALWQSGQARTLKAGEYRFDQPMSLQHPRACALSPRWLRARRPIVPSSQVRRSAS